MEIFTPKTSRDGYLTLVWFVDRLLERISLPPVAIFAFVTLVHSRLRIGRGNEQRSTHAQFAVRNLLPSSKFTFEFKLPQRCFV
jgi:hypothetical protein